MPSGQYVEFAAEKRFALEHAVALTLQEIESNGMEFDAEEVVESATKFYLFLIDT